MPVFRQNITMVVKIPDLTNHIVKIQPAIVSKGDINNPNTKVKKVFNVWRMEKWEPIELVRLEYIPHVEFDGKQFLKKGKSCKELNAAPNLADVKEAIKRSL